MTVPTRRTPKATTPPRRTTKGTTGRLRTTQKTTAGRVQQTPVPTTTSTSQSNSTKTVSGNGCGQSTWGTKEMVHCAFIPGIFMIEVWVAVGVAALLLLILIIGICCCCCRAKSDYPDMGIQLRNYDWVANPEKYDKL